MAWVEQDYLRRILLREREGSGGVNIGLIEANVEYARAHGYHVILEGILYLKNYGEMLQRLKNSSHGPAYFYYFDLPFDETVHRHATRPQAQEFMPDEMRDWFVPQDLLPFAEERLIIQDASLQDTINRIWADTQLKPAHIHPSE